VIFLMEAEVGTVLMEADRMWFSRGKADKSAGRHLKDYVI
jgi:hypothetical protein